MDDDSDDTTGTKYMELRVHMRSDLLVVVVAVTLVPVVPVIYEDKEDDDVKEEDDNDTGCLLSGRAAGISTTDNPVSVKRRILSISRDVTSLSGTDHCHGFVDVGHLKIHHVIKKKKKKVLSEKIKKKKQKTKRNVYLMLIFRYAATPTHFFIHIQTIK